MAIPEGIETFMLRLGFQYSTLQQGSPSSGEQDGGGGRSEWVQTIVYIADKTPILATVPANARVDPHRLRQLAAVSRLRVATDEEVAHLHPESEPDAVPPLGPLFGQRVFVDETVSRHEYIVFRAGSRSDAIRMRYGDFAELVHPFVGRFAVSA
jgi:Ala-tRNA(Pro) deacylase